MGSKTREIILLVISAACIAFALADSARFFTRVDLTRNRAYSISPVSAEILRSIPEQVHVIYYLSDTLRSLSPAVGRVIETLDEYAARSRGRLSVTVVEPQREGRTESARRFGILPQQVQVIQQNERRTVDVFSGLVVEYLDRFTTLPAVFTPDGLEFNLGFAIRTLLAGKRLSVGVVIGRPDKSFARDFENLQVGLSRNYRLREFVPGERIPPEVDVLLVLGGTGLAVRDLAPIDRYVMDGGKVIFGVKGLRVETAQSLGARGVGPSALLDMLAAYGVRVGRAMVLDSSCRDYRVPQQTAGGVAWETLGPYPPWVAIRAPGVSSSNPVTASFSGLDLLWPSPLEASPAAGVTAEVLARSSPSSWVVGEPFLIDPIHVSRSGPGQADQKNRQSLVIALSGRFPQAFPAAGAGPAAGAAAAATPAGARGLPTRMLVIGDDDFASDLMQFSDSRSNVLFLENAALWLSGNADLLALKTRAAQDSRLDRIADPAARRRMMLAAEMLNVCAIPLLVLAFGLTRMLRRRERGDRA
jgi:ABC-2 type transport system permease protein